MRPFLGILLASALAGPVGAQQFPVAPIEQEQAIPTILTVDLERIFAQSAFGSRIVLEYNSARAELAMENRRIAEALREEELSLAERRPDMERDLFQAEAAAFDEKAQGIRRAQDAKERALDAALDQGRAQFLEVSRPILGQLMVERGAFAILDRRTVVLSLGACSLAARGQSC